MAERKEWEIALDTAVAEAVEAVGYTETSRALEQWLSIIEHAETVDSTNERGE